jgi:signal transduction histidine kinase
MPIPKYITFFIHPKLKEQELALFKANALVWLHLIILCFLLGLKVIEFFTGIQNDIELFYMLPVILLQIAIFRYSASFTLSSNLFVMVIAAFLVFGVNESGGGIISDNLLWGILLPMISLLFAGFRYGLFWLILLILFSYWQSIYSTYELNHLYLQKHPPIYFFISYSFLFIGIFLVLNVFRIEQHKLISSLSDKNHLLEVQKAEIIRKTNDIEEAKAQLESSNKELEQFAYVASHDLKEPLRMISMYTQMLQRRLKGLLEGDTIEFMGFVIDGVQRMQQMLEDLLNYSRLGKTQDIVKVDLNNTVFIAQQNLKLTIREKNAKIEAESLPTIYAVSSEVTQLFQNLIGNAIKFQHKDRSPEVKIGVHKIDSESFILFVKDNGIGIPEDSKTRIFNLFERLHNRDEYQGTGIGLATCYKVMDNLGGEIWVESTETVGSTFYLKFPSKVLEEPDEEN